MRSIATSKSGLVDQTEASEDATEFVGRTLSSPSLLGLIALPVCYFAVAVMAIHSTAAANNVAPDWIAPIWFSNAIVVAALLRNRLSYWPILLLLAAAADLSANLVMGSKWGATFSIVACDMLEQLVVASCMSRIGNIKMWFGSIRWMVTFGAACALATGTAAFLGANLLTLLGEGQFEATFKLWFAADFLGLVIAIPLLMSWTEPLLHGKTNRLHFLEVAAWVATAGVLTAIVFSKNGSWPLLFLIFPSLILTAVRTGLLGATAAVTLVGILAIYFTINGSGPVAALQELSAIQKILYLQFYVLIVVLSILLLAATVVHRELLERKLSRQSQISSAALENMSQGLAQYDREGKLVICNSKYVDLYQLPPALTQEGTHRDAVNAHIRSLGEYDEALFQHFTDQKPSPSDASWRRELVRQNSGKVIEINRQALPDGGWVATYGDVTERQNAEARIVHLATHDPLTGLVNRAGFNDRLRSLFAGRQSGQTNALFLMDVDHFKRVNDTMGHAAGDELLRQIGRRLSNIVRETDTVSRLGGDEFAILLSNVSGQDAVQALVERMLLVINAPYLIFNGMVNASMSIGISLIPDDTVDPEKLMRQADLALYHSKAAGRSTYRFFEPQLEAEFLNRMNIERELASAITQGQLVLHYQPIASLRAAAITSFEALVRWRHPTRGLLYPDQFIPIAESAGLMRQLGSWVLNRACADAVRWPPGIRVAVNLSSSQFYKNKLVAEVVEVLQTTGLEPERLELELTESTLLAQTELNGTTLNELRELGVLLVLDDFGTGYSSLKYLNSFKFHKLKIDRSFVKNLDAECSSVTIIYAINQLAHALNMEVVVEGVETPEQLMIVQAARCDQVQGYYIGRPREVDSVAEVITRYNQSKSASPLAERPKLLRV